MPRKKPFSSKQKKKQLLDKRKRKQEEGPQYVRPESSDVDLSDDDKDITTKQGTSTEVVKQKLSQQSGYLPEKKHDPNRYRLLFFQETKDELERRKKEARNPYIPLPEEALEMEMATGNDIVIDIPKRPPWNYNLSKQQLENNEEKYFQAYVESMFSKYDPRELSYFEMNIETWRQLWRVLEMSDIFLLITDIRYPTLGFSPALYDYITKDLKKLIVLVLNKVDLARPPLVVAWQHYFKEKFPLVDIVCFTSFPKDENELAARSGSRGIQRKRKRGTYRALGPKELYRACCHLVKDQVDLSSWEAKIDEDQESTHHGDTCSSEEELLGDATGDELDCSYQEHTECGDGVLTIGCIGYPNVGKSSVLNGLMGKKVVSVSKSPGHTKHFQTIYLTPTVRLCDCPGLVFPSKVDKNLQMVAGIYPISQVREPYSTIGYIAQRLDVPSLLKLKHPETEEAKNVEWSATDICYAWAEKRGFLTAKAARADTYRAANQLLRMTVTGQLCLCFTPRGYTKNADYWKCHPETKELINSQIKYRVRPGQAAEGSEEEDTSSDEELQQGSELSGDDEETNQKQSIESMNPFALLGED